MVSFTIIIYYINPVERITEKPCYRSNVILLSIVSLYYRKYFDILAKYPVRVDIIIIILIML